MISLSEGFDNVEKLKRNAKGMDGQNWSGSKRNAFGVT